MMRRNSHGFSELCSIFKSLTLMTSLFLLPPVVHADSPAEDIEEEASTDNDDEVEMSTEPEEQVDVSAVCWKESYGRGVGTVPGTCGPGEVKSGLLCYPQPEPGYNVVAGIYSQSCPPDFRDDGLFCAKPAAYGRGAGYPWKFGDRAFSLDDARARCASDNSQGCDTDGAVVYPKCKPNFHAVGCCTCSHDCPAGMTDIGVSCAKKTYVKPPIAPKCAAGEDYDAGLCYKPCADGSKGVGPVCWTECPASMVNCGAMCGTSKEKCAEAVGQQVLAVGKSAYKVYNQVSKDGKKDDSPDLNIAEVDGVKNLSEVIAKDIKDKGLNAEGVISALKSGASTKLGPKTLTQLKALSHTFGDDKKKLVDVLKDPRGYDYLTNLKDIKAFGIGKVVKSFDKPICGK